MTNEAQKEFLKNMFFAASWSAATGHHNVWNDECKENKNKRVAFRLRLKDKAEEMIKTYKDTRPSVEQHIKNIQGLKEFSKNVEIEKNGVIVSIKNELNIGTVQKLLNLLCKYHWCAGFIQEPPHLPIDSIMLNKIENKKKLTKKWTQLDSIEEYQEIIAGFKKDSSLAQWELQVWNKEMDRINEKILTKVTEENA